MSGRGEPIPAPAGRPGHIRGRCAVRSMTQPRRKTEAMHDPDVLARQFEAHRAHLRAVAYRMLGSHSEAEDAVQETWLRLSRDDRSDVENLGGWLTTVVSRVCLNMLQ